jgi:DNA-directed RNA polymerase specialized sigma24 family protein
VTDWPSFLFKLAFRRATDRLRQRYRWGDQFIEIGNAHAVVSHTDDPIDHAKTNELMEWVRKEIAALPVKQAEVSWLSCIEELTQAIFS